MSTCMVLCPRCSTKGFPMEARPIISGARGVAVGDHPHRLRLHGGVPQQPPVSTTLLIPSRPVQRGPLEPRPCRRRWLVCR